jgi:putative transcriptional regulator
MVQEDLAALVGVRATTISRLERGTTGPSFDLARSLARVLGVTVDDLFESDPERVA